MVLYTYGHTANFRFHNCLYNEQYNIKETNKLILNTTQIILFILNQLTF